MQGLIIIPDISGFTNFVNSVDIHLGVSVTKDLLNEIISSNCLDVDLSEIEGDAVLYYKIGKPICIWKIFEGLKKIALAFNTTYSCLKKQHSIKADLSLKFIVHYGNIHVYDIQGFRKLYGETVIESHILLKNGCGASDYILITEDYFKALQQATSHNIFSDSALTYQSSGLFTGLRKIDFYFFSNDIYKIDTSSFIRA